MDIIKWAGILVEIEFYFVAQLRTAVLSEAQLNVFIKDVDAVALIEKGHISLLCLLCRTSIGIHQVSPGIKRQPLCPLRRSCFYGAEAKDWCQGDENREDEQCRSPLPSAFLKGMECLLIHHAAPIDRNYLKCMFHIFPVGG